jgi:hypothetical protein
LRGVSAPEITPKLGSAEHVAGVAEAQRVGEVEGLEAADGCAIAGERAASSKKSPWRIRKEGMMAGSRMRAFQSPRINVLFLMGPPAVDKPP